MVLFVINIMFLNRQKEYGHTGAIYILSQWGSGISVSAPFIFMSS